MGLNDDPEYREIMAKQRELWKSISSSLKAEEREIRLRNKYSGHKKERKWDLFKINAFLTVFSRQWKGRALSMRADGFIKRFQRWQNVENLDTKDVATIIYRMMKTLGIDGRVKYEGDKVFIRFK